MDWRGDGEVQGDTGPKVSNTSLPLLYKLTASPLPPRLPWQGGPVSPHHPPSPLGARTQPQTEPRQLVWGFLAQTPASLAFREPAAPTPSPPRRRRPTISPHRSPSPFPTACPKPSPSSSVSGFWPQPPLPPRVGERPTTTTTSSTSRHRLPPPSPSVAVSHGTPEIEQPRSISCFLALSRLVFANAQPHHHHLIHAMPPPPPFTLHHHFTWRARFCGFRPPLPCQLDFHISLDLP